METSLGGGGDVHSSRRMRCGGTTTASTFCEPPRVRLKLYALHRTQQPIFDQCQPLSIKPACKYSDAILYTSDANIPWLGSFSVDMA